MAIDPSKVIGFEYGESKYAYTKDDVILYQLGIGAGVPSTDPGELEYTYEKELKVLPSFGSIPAQAAVPTDGGPSIESNPRALLGEQSIEFHQPIPPEATLTQRAQITEVWDKKKAAVIVTQVESRDEAGRLLFTNTWSDFRPGQGGFGGEPGPKLGNTPPPRDPDGVVDVKSLPQQALLYRLSGDKYELHVDPEFAALAGFERPIMHGLCSYGIVCKAIVDGVIGGDVTAVARYQARFAGVAFPGETYRIAYWKVGSTLLIEAKSLERDTPILSNAAISVRGD